MKNPKEDKIGLLPPDLEFLSDLPQELLSEANYDLGRLNGILEFLPSPELLLTPLVVSESLSSSRIENINSTLVEQLQLELKGRKPYSSEQKEVKFYKDALLFGFEYVEKEKRFDLELILRIHRILEPELDGFRDREELVIANSASGEVLWVPPRGRKKIETLLENWFDFANDLDDGVGVLVKSAILHSQFEAIHPFVDGNGRVGRILFLLYLIFRGKLAYPALYLSGYILQTRTKYYLSLQEAQKEDNLKDLTEYLIQAVVEKSKLTINLIDRILELKKSYDLEIQKRLPKIYSKKLLDFLFTNPFYSQKAIGDYLGISRNTASKYLSLLLKNDFIYQHKKGREKVYYNPPFLKIFD